MSAELINNVTKAFNDVFHYAPTHIIQAPGRVNLIGEHTDYNDGFVLPSAINYQAIVAAKPRDDQQVNVISVDYNNAQDSFSLAEPIVATEQDWANYIRGVVKHLQLRGYQFNGADIAVSGNVPQGAGLSSSAALEVVIGQTFKELFGLSISQQDIALNGQEAENHFVGCNCGIMDQLISAEAKKDHALLIDCRSLETTPVSLPQGMSIVIVNSNKKRGLVDSEYNTRREQCEAAAQFFGVNALRDVTIDMFKARENELDEMTAKRARHVITENDRTVAAATAMQNNDISTLQRLMAESHASMRDDFEITVPEIDSLVAIIKGVVGEQGGVRMTGGGFGGCVVSIVPDAMVEQVIATVEKDYPEKTGLQASVFVCSAEEGASLISVK
ncbi:galactokinase [Thalassotalea agariperforans]